MSDRLGALDPRTDVLMDIAVVLADSTESEALTLRIPDFLAGILGFDCLSMAVLQESPESKVLLAACSIGASTTQQEALSRDMLTIHQAHRKSSVNGMGIIRLESLTRLESPQFAERTFAVVVGHSLEPGFSLQLTVHHRAAEPPAAFSLESLRLAAVQLSRLLACNIAWNFHPEAFGAPFNQLTDREWVVLRRLDEDVAEKQLAERLELSPHTLHSHIKAIYRKIGVQGRMALLLAMREAKRKLREQRVGAGRVIDAVRIGVTPAATALRANDSASSHVAQLS